MKYAQTLFVILVLTGCLDPQPPSRPPDGSCDASVERTCHEEPADYVVTGSDCTRIRQSIATIGLMNPIYPPGVKPSENLGVGSGADLVLWECRQVVTGTEIMDNFQVALFSGYIERPNPNDKNLTGALFIFQGYTNSRSLAENASKEIGLDLALAEPATVSYTPATPSAPGLAPSAIYELRLPGVASPDYLLTGQIAMGASFQTDETHGYYLGTSAEELTQMRIHHKGITSGSFHGRAQFGPDSYWAKHSNVRESAFNNGRGTDMSVEIEFRSGA